MVFLLAAGLGLSAGGLVVWHQLFRTYSVGIAWDHEGPVEYFRVAYSTSDDDRQIVDVVPSESLVGQNRHPATYQVRLHLRPGEYRILVEACSGNAEHLECRSAEELTGVRVPLPR